MACVTVYVLKAVFHRNSRYSLSTTKVLIKKILGAPISEIL